MRQMSGRKELAAVEPSTHGDGELLSVRRNSRTSIHARRGTDESPHAGTVDDHRRETPRERRPPLNERECTIIGDRERHGATAAAADIRGHDRRRSRHAQGARVERNGLEQLRRRRQDDMSPAERVVRRQPVDP